MIFRRNIPGFQLDQNFASTSKIDPRSPEKEKVHIFGGDWQRPLNLFRDRRLHRPELCERRASQIIFPTRDMLTSSTRSHLLETPNEVFLLIVAFLDVPQLIALRQVFLFIFDVLRFVLTSDLVSKDVQRCGKLYDRQIHMDQSTSHSGQVSPVTHHAAPFAIINSSSRVRSYNNTKDREVLACTAT